MRSFGGDTNELSSGSAVQSTSSTNLLIVHNILTVFQKSVRYLVLYNWKKFEPVCQNVWLHA